MVLKYTMGSMRVASPSLLSMLLNVLPTARVWEKRRIVFTREELFITFVGGDVVRDMIPLAEVSCVDQVDRAKAIITTYFVSRTIGLLDCHPAPYFRKNRTDLYIKSNFSHCEVSV